MTNLLMHDEGSLCDDMLIFGRRIILKNMCDQSEDCWAFYSYSTTFTIHTLTRYSTVPYDILLGGMYVGVPVPYHTILAM